MMHGYAPLTPPLGSARARLGSSPTGAMAGSHRHLVEVFRRRAQQQADEILFTFLADGESREIHRTYAEMDQQARAIAAELQALGATGERALLIYDPGLDYIAAFAGCLYAGVVAVPLYPPDPLRMHRTLPRLQAVVENAEAKILLTTNSIREWTHSVFGQVTGLETILATDDADPGLESDWTEPALAREDLAFLQYTSGSTGVPKGVMVSHGNLLANLSQIHSRIDVDNAVGVSWLPAYHDMGLIGSILQPWYSGRRSVLLSPLAFFQRPIRWLRAMTEYRATTSAAPNFAYDLCVRKTTPEERATLDLSNWQVALNGSEQVRHDTMERFVDAFAACGMRREAFYPSYGLAEATLMAAGGRVTAAPIIRRFDAAALEQHRAIPAVAGGDSRVLVGCGQVVPGGKLLIVDPHTAAVSPEQSVGEIWIAGGNVARGYWKREDENVRLFRAHTACGQGPLLRTGDMGFVDQGELFVTGRIKELIIVRGRNHYPQDIERTVERCHPALKPHGGAAFAIDDQGEERLVVVHEVLRPKRVDLDALIESIRREVVEEHQAPLAAVVLIAPGTLPKTTSGKTQRADCRELFLTGELSPIAEWRAGTLVDSHSPAEYVAPRNAAEVFLAGVWAEVLGVSRVGVHDHFLDLGGDSMLATQLVSRLAPYFKHDLPLRSLFERPTVAALAEIMEPPLAPQADEAAMLAILQQLEQMTDQEAAHLLAAPGSQPGGCGRNVEPC